jgi:hypothetical protein
MRSVRYRRGVGEAAGDGRLALGLVLLDERQVAPVLGFLLAELARQRLAAVSFHGEAAHEDLVAQRRRPGRTPFDPGAQHAAAARRELEVRPHARADRDVAAHDQSDARGRRI